MPLGYLVDIRSLFYCVLAQVRGGLLRGMLFQQAALFWTSFGRKTDIHRASYLVVVFMGLRAGKHLIKMGGRVVFPAQSARLPRPSAHRE